MRYMNIDALPLLFEGGISNYTRPLVESIAHNAAPSWQVGLLFRLGITKSRKRALTRYKLARQSMPCLYRHTFLPDRFLEFFWKKGHLIPLWESKGDEDIFIATTNLVPKIHGARVGWVIHDLMQARIPEYFSFNKEVFISFLNSFLDLRIEFRCV